MKRLLFALATAAGLLSTACGGGSSVQPPPPVGKYSMASLNGQYAFVTNGEVFTSGSNAPVPLARTGVFIADGNGNITGGMEDVNADGTPSNAIVITNGKYTVSADGRGAMTLNLGTSTLDFGITLTSTSDGLLIDETSNSNQASTGSGNFVLQKAAPFALTDVNGPYVFDFPGLDANNNPESFIGEFTVDNTGAIPTGFFDDNVNGNLTSGGMSPGSIAQDPLQLSTLSSFGRGIANIAGQNFVFYIVDSRRVRFVSTSGGMLSGDAVTQSTNVPTSTSNFNGSFAFVLAGASANGGVTRVGRFTANGATVGNVLGDTNDAGRQHPSTSFSSGTITFDSANPGRGQITFQDPSFPFTFVFYLSSASSGVIQDVTQSSAGVGIVVADGSIELQSGSPFTSVNVSGTYAMNWSGLVVAGGSFPIEDEEDLLAQANVSSMTLSGAADLFQFTSATLTPQLDLGVGGVIQINGTDGTSGDGSRNGMTVNLTGANPINFVVYFVNPQLAFFANRDNSGAQRIVVGILKLQQ